MNAKTAAMTLSRGQSPVTPEALMALSRSGFIGEQKIEGGPWLYKTEDISLLLDIMTKYQASLTEAARLFRLERVVAILQAGNFATDTEHETLQRELQGLQSQFDRSGNRKLQRRVDQIRSQFSGGSTKILQLAG